MEINKIQYFVFSNLQVYSIEHKLARNEAFLDFVHIFELYHITNKYNEDFQKQILFTMFPNLVQQSYIVLISISMLSKTNPLDNLIILGFAYLRM